MFVDSDWTGAHAYKLPTDVLRGRRRGRRARAHQFQPVPTTRSTPSSERLSGRALFPNLREIVLTGHGGGGQIVQRHAIVGHQIAAVEKTGIALRYVVPILAPIFASTHTARRLATARHSTTGSTACGLGLLPAYLLGTGDDDPNGHDIDKAYAAEFPGATRRMGGAKLFQVSAIAPRHWARKSRFPGARQHPSDVHFRLWE